MLIHNNSRGCWLALALKLLCTYRDFGTIKTAGFNDVDLIERVAKVTTTKRTFARLTLPRKILKMKRENLQLKRHTNIATMPLSR
jgi:hypothetical protein